MNSLKNLLKVASTFLARYHLHNGEVDIATRTICAFGPTAKQMDHLNLGIGIKNGKKSTDVPLG